MAEVRIAHGDRPHRHVRDWVPAFPPIEAAIGISTARMTICSIVASNIQITTEARIAVTRLTKSQENRAFPVSIAAS